jgi:hypothetical protein
VRFLEWAVGMLKSKWMSGGSGRPVADLIITSDNTVSHPFVYEYV